MYEEMLNRLILEKHGREVISRECIEWLCGTVMSGNVIINELHEGRRELMDCTWWREVGCVSGDWKLV